MNVQVLTLFMIFSFLTLEKSVADDSSAQFFDQSCREFKELMSSGNKLIFLRSDVARNNSTWKAVICLHCSESREGELIKVTSLKDGSADWHYKDKYFLAINEIIGSEDDLTKEKLGMHSILNQVRQTCRSYLDPVNEGSHLELSGNESCARHEYLRLYLKRKYDLNENSYAELESKKDLALGEFTRECHQVMQHSTDKNIFTKALASIFLETKRFFGQGLGEYDPIVSRDSKSFQREIATEAKGIPSK